MKTKLTWRVGTKPTGRYRSFEHRSWPRAEWPSGECAANIYCEDDYTAPRARREQPHAPLRVNVAVYDETGKWRWATLKGRPPNLDEAKQLVNKFFTLFPEKRPPNYIRQEFN